MSNITISVTDVKENKVKLKRLGFDDLFDYETSPDLLFDKVIHENEDKTIRLLECKNCRLGMEVYIFLFDGKQTIFAISECGYIKIGDKKIKMRGWDEEYKLSLESGKIKQESIR